MDFKSLRNYFITKYLLGVFILLIIVQLYFVIIRTKKFARFGTREELPKVQNDSPDSNVSAELKELTFEEVSSGNLNISQDDPRLLKYIREHHLTPPPQDGFLTRATYKNPHQAEKQFEQLEIYRYVHNLLNNMSGGFFIECGANDGTFYSNTLPLELDYGWKGLLIEADPNAFKALQKVKRNAWISDVCLSTKPFPIKMSFMTSIEFHSSISYLKSPDHKIPTADKGTFLDVKVQCMPFYSILKAINVTQVDFISLDIEDAELKVLKTIPWDSVYIKVLAIEAYDSNQEPVKAFMTSIGYKYLTFIHNSFSVDQIYIHPNVTQSN